MTPTQFLQEKKIITEFIQVQSFTERNGFALIPLLQLLTEYANSIQLMQTAVSSGLCNCDADIPCDIVCQECHKKVV